MPSFTVPYSSQYADVGRHDWRARGCGIASLHMVMAYWHAQRPENILPKLDTLLERGLAVGAYREGIGWTHAGLVALARDFGYEGYNYDFAPQGPTPKSVTDAWDVLVRELESGPVLASVFAGLDPERKGGHIVVVTGIHDGLVLFNDPEEMTEREGRRMLALDVFLRAFKLRSIIVRPSGSDPVR